MKEIRQAYMAGFIRKITWEQYQRETDCAYSFRIYFMMGYTRDTQWSRIQKALEIIEEYSKIWNEK